MAFFEFLDGIARFLQGLVDLNEVFSWGSSKKKNDKRNALQSNGPQANTRGGCFLRGLGCLFILAVVVLGTFYIIGTFVAPPKSTVAQTTPTNSTIPTNPSPRTPSSIKDIKIPTVPK